MKRALSKDEQMFCDSKNLEIGFDIDTTPHQFSHICYPYESGQGTLCKSEDLWFQGKGFIEASGKASIISCLQCLDLLDEMINS